jgi:peptidoglycan/xylan/chitin deacetylase (PgdA/CDA1 family)
MALTFEAGGDPDVSAQMLDVLHEKGVPTTIFLDGAWSARYPDLVRRMVDEGHELGNHAYTHPDLTLLSDDEVRSELRRTDELALELTGKTAKPWLRPPFAACDDRIRQIAREEGYRIVQRDAVDGGHWPGETNSETIVARTLECATLDGVVAYHINSVQTLRVLGAIIDKLTAMGYSFCQLSDMPAVSERVPRHADFVILQINPGYLQSMQRGARLWSLNLPEFGARANAPIAQAVRLAAWNGASAALLTGQDESGWYPAVSQDRYLVVLAGSVECLLRQSGSSEPLARIIAHQGDMLLWAADYEAQLHAVGDPPRRWIALILA